MFTFDGNIVSDLHKDAYGFRPSSYFWEMWNEADDVGKQLVWDRLLEVLAIEMESSANQEVAAINAFEHEIATALDLGAPSRQDAVRWVVDAMELDDVDLMYGGEHICYRKGLPYRMAPMFNNAINSLRAEVA